MAYIEEGEFRKLERRNKQTLKVLKYAVSILESLPETMLDELQDNILDESIKWEVFVKALYGKHDKTCSLNAGFAKNDFNRKCDCK